MKVSAVMAVRNEEPVLRLNLAYHRALGIDDFWVTDNGSTDATAQILQEEQDAWGDVHWRSEPGGYRQAEMNTAAAREAHSEGADWIVPIDGDEFWWTDGPPIQEVLDAVDRAGVLECGLDNFVQRRSVESDGPGSLLSMTYSARQMGTQVSARDLVCEGKIGFVEMVYPPKVIARSSPGLELRMGNHAAVGVDGPIVANSHLRVLHAPMRSKSGLVKRAEQGVRIQEEFPNPDTGWHLKRWARLLEEGSLESDWGANSQRFGYLRVGNRYHRLKRDLRLRDGVIPFVEGSS